MDEQAEIAYYNALPCVFNGFINPPSLYDGEILLLCTEKTPAYPEKNLVPSYSFSICKNGKQVGSASLRIGYTEGLYYAGQIGYKVDEAHRGKGYAVRACRLIVPVARAHAMTKLLITNDVENPASRRVCEKLGCRLLRTVRLPEWSYLYQEGQRFTNIFEWNTSSIVIKVPS